jgi:Fic family protein
MKKSGVKYYEPKLLPKKGAVVDANAFTREKSEAEYNLGQLQALGGNSLGKKFFNAELLISPLITKEAVMGSKIEGTISTVSDVYKYEAGQKTHYSGTAEVFNYRHAMREAIDLVQAGKKITKSHIKGIHKTLLTGVRHKGTLGDFRNCDVWIGEKPSDPIEKAIYVPPYYPAVDMYMDNLFEYIEQGADDPLTKAGLVHYQFEAVHPFEDGNGRVGRWLIPLILFENGRLSQPTLYMSGYFDAHRDLYRESLHNVDATMKYEGWLKFFFSSVAAQAKETLALIEKINMLYDQIENEVSGSKSPYLQKFLAYIFEHPIFFATPIVVELNSTLPPVAGLIKLFEEKKLITRGVSVDKRVKVYTFEPLIELLNKI